MVLLHYTMVTAVLQKHNIEAEFSPQLIIPTLMDFSM